MILKIYELVIRLWPKSLRAFAAEVVMFISVTALVSTLQATFTSLTFDVILAIKLVASFIVGIVSTGVFYYYQSWDGSYHELETLEKSMNAHTDKSYHATVVTSSLPDTEEKKIQNI